VVGEIVSLLCAVRQGCLLGGRAVLEAGANRCHGPVRPQDSRYDELLMSGLDRSRARARVQAKGARVLSGWRWQ